MILRRSASIRCNISRASSALIRDVWDMGFDAVRWLWRYFLLGAVIVIPIWLILRLVRRAARALASITAATAPR